MQTEILHLLLRYHALGSAIPAPLFLHLLDVALGVDTETANLNFSSRHCALRIYDYRNEGLLMLLIERLRSHVDT